MSSLLLDDGRGKDMFILQGNYWIVINFVEVPHMLLNSSQVMNGLWLRWEFWLTCSMFRTVLEQFLPIPMT